MVITIIAEPRSGSTNLANWFIYNKNFTILYEPITSADRIWYKNKISPKLWIYETPHILIKETYDTTSDFSELMEISDKVIILYREDTIEQTQSWLNSIKTNNWDKPYYNNGFQKVLDYLNMDELENKNFPYGQKYRINANKTKSLI